MKKNKVLIEKFKDKNNCYIYVYLDPRKPGKYIYGEYSFDYEPFYIGKGAGNRWIHHIRNVKNNIKDVNPKKINKIKKILKEGYNLEFFVIKIYQNLNSNFANLLETKIIDVIGKLNEKKGPLLNVGNGNNTGSKTERNEATKKKLSESKKGKKNPMYGKIQHTFGKKLEEIHGIKRAKEIKEKLRISHLNKKQPDNVKTKMSISQKNRWVLRKRR